MKRENATRTAALALLAKHGEMRAGDMVAAIGCTSGMLSTAMRVAIRDGEAVERRTPGAVFYALPSPPDKTFRAARWADGDIDLYGLVELDDGGFRLTPDMVAQVAALIGPINHAT